MISHKHKFIFIHIPKCGGTSIEQSFGFRYKKFSFKRSMGLHPNRTDNFWLQHCTLREIPTECGVDVKNFFTFTIVRNPWDRMVSSFFYESRINKKRHGFKFNNFNAFVRSPTYAAEQHSLCQMDFIINERSEPYIDFIGRFENLQEDFNTVCDKIGIPRKQLPHKNKTKHKHYTEYYDDETKQIVAKKYAKDIEYFGYKFGE